MLNIVICIIIFMSYVILSLVDPVLAASIGYWIWFSFDAIKQWMFKQWSSLIKIVK